jgi:fatty acid desaturase
MTDRTPERDEVATQVHRDKIERDRKSLWKRTAVVMAVIAVVMLVLLLIGVVPVGFAVGIWVGLIMIWVIGYIYGLRAARRL